MPKSSLSARDSLRITEIFYSLQGETSRVGIPTVFIRLTGCPLRCHYCDTTYAFTGGNNMALDDILHEVTKYPTRNICVTGGEPLAQKGCIKLMQLLCDKGYDVSLETSGALDIATVDQRVAKVLDVKTPASGEVEKNLWRNFASLNSRDEVKFVLCGVADYEWAKTILQTHHLAKKCDVLFSPSQGQLEARELADWILRDGLQVRLQVQLHKLLWENQQGK
ncbi:MAG: 7-carboxy-7-deazaguanine synthase QueE [Gallionellaceae bacterium]|nr:7-carboxy-7-deazaguanine synthase QueE [Gallionellaceae bacterium]